MNYRENPDALPMKTNLSTSPKASFFWPHLPDNDSQRNFRQHYHASRMSFLNF